MAEMLRRMGLDETDMGSADGFAGAIFPTVDGESWVEMWPETEGVPNGYMLQIIVADADADTTEELGSGLVGEGKPFAVLLSEVFLNTHATTCIQVRGAFY